MNDNSTSHRRRLSPSIMAGLFVAFFFGISLFIRAYFPHEQIFSGEWIKFSSVDAYFHMRLIDSLVHNFPSLIDFDPYLLYPFGMNLDNIHFFDWLLAGIIWVFGLGSPSQHTVDIIAVYFPAVLAALTVIPVYFIGKELFGRWAGVISAGLIATLPGEYVGRSILGFTDHHVAETLFITITMMFLIMAVKRAKESALTVQHLQNRDWKVIRKPLIYSSLAGLSLGIYLVTWIGGLLFVFIILLYLFIQFIIDHLKRDSTAYLLPAGIITFFMALIIYVIFTGGTFTLNPSSVIPWLALLVAAALPIVLHLISAKYASKKIRPYWYPVTIFGTGLISIAIIALVAPYYIRYAFDIFNPFGVRTIIEMQSILAPRGEFTFELVWGNFGTAFFLTFIFILYFAIYYILRIFIGERVSEFKIGSITVFPDSFTTGKNILLIWSLVILLATIGQRRFAYYLAVNVALLAGFLSWRFFEINRDIHPVIKYVNLIAAIAAILLLILFADINPALIAILVSLLIAYSFWQFSQILGISRFTNPRPETQKRSKHRERSPARLAPALYYANIAVVIIILFFLVFFPNIKPAVYTASRAQYTPSDAWARSLDWMRENTPAPFGDSNFYYELYEAPRSGEQYDYPDSSYAVMAWVDYGYWIARIAQRPVNLTPGPGGFYVARFFLSQDEESSQEVEWETSWEQETIPESSLIDKLGARYIMLDEMTTTSKFWALVNWSKEENTKYFDNYLLPQEEGKFVGVTLFHPEYYRSLAVRLYNFDGKAVTPIETVVISYEEKPFQEGGTVKVVSSIEFFPSYEEANNYIASQKSGQFQVVGDSPYVSPVPLEELKHYQLIYHSPESTYQAGVGSVPSVKIFEYVK